MYIIEGKYNKAKIMLPEGNYLDEATTSQIYSFLGHLAFADTDIVIMPDAHAGSGSCIGYTATMNKYIIPSVVGVDISCGIDSYNLGIIKMDKRDLGAFDNHVRANVPSGFNNRKKAHKYALLKYFKEEVERVSRKFDLDDAKVKTMPGSLGGGNHFIELNKDQDENIWLTVHTGSRNFGLQVAQNHQKIAQEKMREKYHGADGYKQLAYLEVDSPEGEAYLGDMQFAQTFADVNRGIIVKELLIFFDINDTDYYNLSSNPKDKAKRECIRTTHNYVNFEDNIVRKGAIQAKKGQRVLIPLNMRDGTIVATGKGNDDWNQSAPHGAGRIMSRSQAKKRFNLVDFKSTMGDVYSTSVKKETIDECPMAYKDKKFILEAIGDTVDIDFVMKPIYNFKAS